MDQSYLLRFPYHKLHYRNFSKPKYKFDNHNEEPWLGIRTQLVPQDLISTPLTFQEKVKVICMTNICILLWRIFPTARVCPGIGSPEERNIITITLTISLVPVCHNTIVVMDCLSLLFQLFLLLLFLFINITPSWDKSLHIHVSICEVLGQSSSLRHKTVMTRSWLDLPSSYYENYNSYDTALYFTSGERELGMWT